MTNLIAWLSTAFIGLVLVALIVLLLTLAVFGKDWVERTVRFLAISMGFVAYFGSMVLGISLPALLYQAAETGGLLQSSFYAVLVPAFVGFAMSAFIAKALRQGGDRQVKSLLLVGTLVFCAFGDIFASNVLKQQTHADFRRQATEAEKRQEQLREKLASSDYASYADSTTEKANKRQNLEAEISRLDKVRSNVEQREKRLLITLLGPNITFVLSLLGYLVFVFDRGDIDRIRKATLRGASDLRPNPLVEATSNGVAPAAGKARFAHSALPTAGATPSASPHRER